MNNVPFPDPVKLTLRSNREPIVASSWEAIECLRDQWPEWARGRATELPIARAAMLWMRPLRKMRTSPTFRRHQWGMEASSRPSAVEPGAPCVRRKADANSRETAAQLPLFENEIGARFEAAVHRLKMLGDRSMRRLKEHQAPRAWSAIFDKTAADDPTILETE